MQKIVPSIDDTPRSHTLSLLFRYPYCVQLTSEAFCSSAVGIDKSSLSANAIVGDNVVIAAMEANEVFMKADLSQVDDDVSCAQRETSFCLGPPPTVNADVLSPLSTRATRLNANEDDRMFLLSCVQVVWCY